MDQILKVLTLYDITAYLLPGVVIVWAFLRFRDFVQRGWEYPWSWKLILVAYIVGQLLQAVASEERRWRGNPIYLRSLDEVFAGNDHAVFREQLKTAIKETFRDPPPAEWFLLCESYIRENKLESFVEIMQARYGFFRGLYLALAAAVVMLIVAALVRACTRTKPSGREWMEHALLIVGCAVAAWLSCERKDDFYKYYSEGTYRTFYVDHALNEKRGAR